MKKSLFEITKDLEAIAEQLETQELTPDLEKALSISQTELQVKAIGYAQLIKEFDYDLMVIDKEINRLQALKKANTKKRDVLEERISAAMLAYGVEKVEVETLKLSFRESKQVEVLSLGDLPKKYVTEKTTYTPDKTAIKKAIEAGEDVRGAHIKVNQNLQIK